MTTLKEKLGFTDITDKRGLIWKACAAEFVGNLLLNFFGCGSALKVSDPTRPTDVVQIALTFGLVIFVAVQALCHVSGAHFNPSVTIAMAFSKKIPLIRAILYVISQCLGAVTGSAILQALIPKDQAGELGLTKVNEHLSPVQGFGVEYFLGFILVLVVFGVCDANRNPLLISAPLAIGLAVTVGHLVAVDLTGCGMNPARAFGSAAILNNWTNHWVYWLGPNLGAITAAVVYRYGFSASSEDYTAVRIEERELQTLQKGP